MLLEIVAHEPAIWKDASVLIIGSNREDVRFSDFLHEDLLRLLSDLYVNVPHTETKLHGNLMYPMSVDKGRITFIGDFPSFRSGIWLTPFESLGGGKTEIEKDLQEYGPRDLNMFQSQALSNTKRSELWQRFVKKN